MRHFKLMTQIKAIFRSPNDGNNSTQHTCILYLLLGATCCLRLARLLWRVATRWVLLAQFWPFFKLENPIKRSQNVNRAHRNIVGQNMLRLLAQIWQPFKFEPTSPNRSQHVAMLGYCSAILKLVQKLRQKLAEQDSFFVKPVVLKLRGSKIQSKQTFSKP